MLHNFYITIQKQICGEFLWKESSVQMLYSSLRLLCCITSCVNFFGLLTARTSKMRWWCWLDCKVHKVVMICGLIAATQFIERKGYITEQDTYPCVLWIITMLAWPYTSISETLWVFLFVCDAYVLLSLHSSWTNYCLLKEPWLNNRLQSILNSRH